MPAGTTCRRRASSPSACRRPTYSCAFSTGPGRIAAGRRVSICERTMSEDHDFVDAGWRSCAATRRGPNHSVNEDSFGDIDEAGVYVVADGVGGHTDGGLPSRAIVELLNQLPPSHGRFDARAQL